VVDIGGAVAITTNIANFTLTRGDTFIHRITVKNTDETAKDITGATVRYTLRERTYAGTQVLQKTVGSGIALTTPASGVLDVTLSSADTATLSPTITYVYDCELTLSGQVQTVQSGRIGVIGDVSQ
jgi:hypothetical protein